MAKDQALKGKRILVSLLNKLYDYGQLSQSVYFNIFDTKVSQVLLYGAEIWGTKTRDSIEAVHYYACKRYMCVKQRAANMAVLGDCGRYPLYIAAAKRCIKYWIKILNMQDHRLVKKCYLLLFNMDIQGQTNWVTDIKYLLTRNGFGYVWYNQKVNNDKLFIKVLIQRLKDQFVQVWSSNISNSSKLLLYRNFKNTFEHEVYLDVLKIRKFRSAMAKLRTSNHDLNIERGRYTNIPRNERHCVICNKENTVETEFHFILICDAYSLLREQYIPRKFWVLPNINKFNILINTRSENVLKNLAYFIYYAKYRENLLNR